MCGVQKHTFIHSTVNGLFKQTKAKNCMSIFFITNNFLFLVQFGRTEEQKYVQPAGFVSDRWRAY